MLLDPVDWSLAFRSDEVQAALPAGLRDRVTLETHAAVMEIATGVHRRVGDAVSELSRLRDRLARALAAQKLRAAVAGTHPCAVAGDTVLSSHPRYRADRRFDARARAPRADAGHARPRRRRQPEDAIRLLNRLRAQLPLLLALSANSPFWRGRPTGFASTRTTLFDAFPRSGLPRRFGGYADWVATVERLLRAGAISDPSFLWWDARLQPRYGTVEIRIMDGQSSVEDVAALAALVQALASLELERREDPGTEPRTDELIEENRFLAARDGIAARLIDERTGRRLPVIERLERLLDACCATPDGWAASASSTPCTGSFATTAPSANSPTPAATTTCAGSPPTSPTPTRRPRPPRRRWKRSRPARGRRERRCRRRRSSDPGTRAKGRVGRIADALQQATSMAGAARPPRNGAPPSRVPGVRFADANDQAHYSCICGHAFKAGVTTSVRCPRCGTAQPW